MKNQIDLLKQHYLPGVVDLIHYLIELPPFKEIEHSLLNHECNDGDLAYISKYFSHKLGTFQVNKGIDFYEL